MQGDKEVMATGIKCRLLKMVLRTLSSDNFDIPGGKEKLCEIHEFSIPAPVEYRKKISN